MLFVAIDEFLERLAERDAPRPEYKLMKLLAMRGFYR
jgi:hypothetical protein